MHQPSQQLLCSIESFSCLIPVTCLSAPVAASILSAGAADCQLLAAALTGGLLQGQESAPKLLEKSHLPWSFLMREDSLQARSTQCSKHCPVCHIHTELKQKQYYHRDQNAGILHLSLWDLIYAWFTSVSSFPVPSLSQIHTATVDPPPKAHVQPGAFLLQVWKGEFKSSEMNSVARCDHSCLLSLNSCCSPLRRSCHMVFLELGEEWKENEPVWRGRVAEAAGGRSKEPQQGSRSHREGCARVNDFAEGARSKDTVDQGKNYTEIFLLYSVYTLSVGELCH